VNEAFYQRLIEKARSYAAKHLPNTGYTVRAMKAVCDAARGAALQDGTNLLVQFALLFDGKKTPEQQIAFPNEKRLPYGDSRSLDKSSDCSSWVQNLFDLFFGINIGSWTEAQWKNLKSKTVAFKNLRPCDLIYWNFKSGRTVSHCALYIGGGKIIHTTSKSNPLRVDSSGYSASKRVGCVRPLTNAQYDSLVYYKNDKGDDIGLKKGDAGEPVEGLQRALVLLGYDLGDYGQNKDGIDAKFGSVTEAAVKAFQTDKGLPVTGVVDSATAAAIMDALSAKASQFPDTEELMRQITSLTAKIEAAKRALA